MERKFNLQKYLEAQIATVKSALNRWYTGEKVGHDPTDSELVENFVQSGAAKKFYEDNAQAFYEETPDGQTG